MFHANHFLKLHFLFAIITICLHVVVWFQVFLSNTNNLYTVIWYCLILLATLNKSWRQHPTKHQLYGHLPPVMKTIQVRLTRHAGHC